MRLATGECPCRPISAVCSVGIRAFTKWLLSLFSFLSACRIETLKHYYDFYIIKGCVAVGSSQLGCVCVRPNALGLQNNEYNSTLEYQLIILTCLFSCGRHRVFPRRAPASVNAQLYCYLLLRVWIDRKQLQCILRRYKLFSYWKLINKSHRVETSKKTMCT